MADAAIQGHEHEDQRGFFTRWFMSTNHKDIGILYLITSALVGFISVAFTVYMRLELMEPGVQYMCLEGMMFFVVIPALFGGFGNYFMPLQLGAPDMAFPRLNNLSYWMYVAGTLLAVCSVLSPGGNDQLGSGVGWVLYPPLSVNEGGMSMDLAIRLWCQLYSWRDQHDHNVPKHACPGHDLVQGSAVFMVNLRHGMAYLVGSACFGRCDHDASDRP